MISQDVKDRILDLDIVTIIENEGVHLVKKGADYECCCPFHGEKTPSFKVSIKRNRYHCFGCCVDGNAIDFVMETKSMKFYEAVEYLADKYDIPYEKEEPSAEERERRYLHSQLMEINRVAVEYFRLCYEQSPAAKQYATGRWKESTINLFQIGYAPSKPGLIAYCTTKGYSKDILLKAGLIKKSENDGSLYDTFRERLMFPIVNRTGNVVGFTGRYIGKKSDIPKYLNTSETELYSKKNTLFGLHLALREIKNNSTVVLVEGNPDVVRLQEIGVGKRERREKRKQW